MDDKTVFSENPNQENNGNVQKQLRHQQWTWKHTWEAFYNHLHLQLGWWIVKEKEAEIEITIKN